MNQRAKIQTFSEQKKILVNIIVLYKDYSYLCS